MARELSVSREPLVARELQRVHTAQCTQCKGFIPVELHKQIEARLWAGLLRLLNI